MKISRKQSFLFCMLFLASVASAGLAALPELSEKQWKKLKSGELVSKVWNEGGTQSAGQGYGIFKHPPELLWKAVCSLELYDEFIARTTVSVLIDEKTKDKILKNKLEDADEVEKLFADMERGYRRKAPDGKWTVYSYQRNDLPWPVSDRWVLLEMTHDDDRMRQEWTRLAGNIKEDFGYWQLHRLDNGQTLGEMEIHLDADIPATGLITDYALSVSMPATYEAFEKIAGHLANKK